MSLLSNRFSSFDLRMAKPVEYTASLCSSDMYAKALKLGRTVETRVLPLKAYRLARLGAFFPNKVFS